MMFSVLSYILLGCSSTGNTKITQETDSGSMEKADSGDISPSDTSSTEPSSEPDNVPVDNDGDGVFEDDCDDADPTVYPQADEICDNKDNNCDGQIDENDVCPCPYRTFENKGYYFCGSAQKWRIAVDDCLVIGATLVSISTEAENTFIAEQANALTEGKWWIGLNDRDEEGEYIWESGTTFDFEAWNEGEPNNYEGSENCVEMYSNSGVWNDVRCRNEQGYICSNPLE